MTHRHRISWAVLLLTAAVLVAGRDSHGAEPMRDRGGPPLPDKGLTRDEARSVNHVVDSRSPVAAWPYVLTDDDDATAVKTSDVPTGAISVRFAGAAEFTNEIELRYRGAGSVSIDMLKPYDDWVRGAVRQDLPAADDWTTVVIPVAPAQYQGFAATFTEAPGKAPIEITQLGAYWFEEELTRDASEVGDEWCEDYPGSGNDLTSPNETAQRFADRLRDEGWTWVFDYGNANAWEEDFKRNDLGGTNNSYIDAVDAFLYCGHGSTNSLSIANPDHDDATVSSADVDNAWGDTDLEWTFFHCCLNLNSTAWASALAGTHTIAGAINVINGSSNWGKTIAGKLIDDGIFDSAWSIYSSWWHSNDTNQPAGNQFRLLAEDQGHYNERIWGQGTVLDDSNDSQHWTISHTVSKLAGGNSVFDYESYQPTSEPVLWEAPPELGDPVHPALTVRVHPEVLQKQLPQVAWILDVLPSGQNDATTLQMFEGLCEALRLDCSDAAVGREGVDGYMAASGLASLYGDNASGGWQFTDQRQHLVPERRPEVQLSPGQAAERARDFLASLRLIDQNSFLADVHVFEASEIDENGEVLQSFPFMYDVVLGNTFGQGQESFPVVGSGGRSHVAVGVDGSIQAFNQVSRRTQPRTAVDLIPMQAALDQLRAYGYASLQAAPEFLAHTIEVRDMNVGYFEQGISSQQSRIGPVYYIDVTMIGPDGEGRDTEVPGRIFLASDRLPVRAQILAPEDGQTFAYGQTISFRGGAANGTAPYSYRWSDDMHGVLSTSQNFSTDQLIPAFREDGSASPITVELQVTDAMGYTSTDQIAIIITGLIGVDDVPSVYSLAPNSPNPFNPRTTIAFAVPTAGHASLRIMDVRGRLVETLLDESVAVGQHARIWNGTDTTGRPVAAGVYLYRLDVRGDDGTTFSETRRMVLVR